MKLQNAGTKKPPEPQSGPIPVIGIDIGQKRDPTALAVVEIDVRSAPTPRDRHRTETHFLTRYLDRLPLGTPYPEIARRLGEICKKVQERSGSEPTIFVDATGVGSPVVDVLRNDLSGVRLWSVFFTHGDRRSENKDQETVSLGKAYLVSRLQALLQCQRLHLPSNSESRALAQELLDYEIRVDENANDRYGAFRVGTHDDLVTAIGLAVQKEPRFTIYPGSKPGAYL